MKKALALLSLILTAATLLSTAAYSTALEEMTYTNEYTAYRDVVPKYDELMSYLYESVVDGEFYVNISYYELKEDYIVPIFNDLISFSPELFFLDSKISYRYATVNNVRYVKGIYFNYNLQGRELWAAQDTFVEEVKYIASLVDPALSEAEKALWVHDYMVSLYAYDSDLLIYDAYRIMTGEYGVCRAYSLAYSAVLEELGMKCTMVISSDMNHAWNLVQVDGKWYHVDLVYDDPGVDKPGRVSHEFFLLSDTEISERESGAHYGWETAIVCDESYSGSKPWVGRKTQLAYLDGKWYYIDEETSAVVGVNWDGSEQETVYSFTNRWYTDQNRTYRWVGVYSGLSTYDGRLVLNTDRRVISLDPETGDELILYEVGETEQLCGVTVRRDEMKCYVSFALNGDENSHIERVAIGEYDHSTSATPTEPTSAMPFDDVEADHPYYSSIEYVYGEGLFNGVSNTKFAPESTLTRAMFVTVLGRLCKIDTAQYNGSTFTDVLSGQWYSSYVSWAAEKGIVNGVGEGKFNPTGELTREQMYKIAAYCAVMLTGDNTVTAGELPFSDRDSVSSWAYDSVRYCLEYGLIDHGVGKIAPQAKATRAEAADIITRLSKLINK